MTTRRGFLGGLAGILAAGVAPGFCRVVMPVRPVIEAPKIIVADPSVTISDYLANEEFGTYDNFRFIESPTIAVAHQRAMTDAITGGMGVLTIGMVQKAVAQIQAQRVEPQEVYFVHPTWAADLRREGVRVAPQGWRPSRKR